MTCVLEAKPTLEERKDKREIGNGREEKMKADILTVNRD